MGSLTSNKPYELRVFQDFRYFYLVLVLFEQWRRSLFPPVPSALNEGSETQAALVVVVKF